jgi:hypothetical protein
MTPRRPAARSSRARVIPRRSRAYEICGAHALSSILLSTSLVLGAGVARAADAPVAVEIDIAHGDCTPDRSGSLEVLLGGVLVARVPTENGCFCDWQPTRVTITDPELLAPLADGRARVAPSAVIPAEVLSPDGFAPCSRQRSPGLRRGDLTNAPWTPSPYYRYYREARAEGD